MTYQSDLVFGRLAALATCLCAELQDPINEVPDVCFCGLIPGNAIPVEYTGDCDDKCGAAWVRLISVYPSDSIGVIVTDPGNCSHGIGIDVEMGIIRCISVGDEQGNPPTAAELLAATDLAIRDATLMMKVLNCCDAVPPKDMVLGQYQAIGPEGGIIGGSFFVSMGAV